MPKNRIRALLKKAGKTQRELAIAVGLTEAAISYQCSGVAAPDRDTALRMAQFLGVSVEELGVREQLPTSRRSIAARINRHAVEKALGQKGISASELARQLGVSRQAISKTLAGRSIPRPPILKHLAEILNIKLGELLLSIDEPTANRRVRTRKAKPQSSDS
jgi:transcriptional regulator with XRE-family HTH domain